MWVPPGKDCGSCGLRSCKDFEMRLKEGRARYEQCPYYHGERDTDEKDSRKKDTGKKGTAGNDTYKKDQTSGRKDPDVKGYDKKNSDRDGNIQGGKDMDEKMKDARHPNAVYTGTDVAGQRYDFVLLPLPGETSARKFILPFRPDITERFEIKKDDIVTGRPAGAGCPVQHVIRVISADMVTGVITGHVVGPEHSREKDANNVKDVKEYHMLGFEGMASVVNERPEFGRRHYFLPGSCMMHRAHTGLVSMVIERPYGTQIRIEDIIIL